MLISNCACSDVDRNADALCTDHGHIKTTLVQIEAMIRSRLRVNLAMAWDKFTKSKSKGVWDSETFKFSTKLCSLGKHGD